MTLNDYKPYLLTGAIALASWLLVRVTGFEMSGSSVVPANSPDVFSNNYSKTEMDEAGRVKTRLTADKMTHLGDAGTTHLDRPLMFFYNNAVPPWQVRSERGFLTADGKGLFLQGKVKVERDPAEGVRAITINTTNVHVKPEISYAETTEWAELISDANRTEGVGMKMVFADPIQLELLAKVKGTYETK